MKKIFLGVLVVALALTAYSFYSDSFDATAYDQIKTKGMVATERKAETGEAEIIENKKVDKQVKAAKELEEWNSLSREEKLKLAEERQAKKVKKQAERWAKSSADKKITDYEKRLKKATLSKEEKKKIAAAKLAEKCKGVDDKDDDKDE